MNDTWELPLASSRFAQSLSLGEDVCRLRYVTGPREEALRRLGLQTVEDLLTHIPHRYLDFTNRYTVEDAPLGEVCTVVATVDKVSNKRTPKMAVTEVYLLDETGVIKAAFFKQPWVAKQLQQGDVLALYGKVEFAYGFKEMASPHFEKLDGSVPSTPILPVHYASEGASPAWMRRIISGAISTAGLFADAMPARLRAKRHLMSMSRAYRALHFPRSMGERELARRRLAYDELFYLQLALRLRNDDNLLNLPPVAHRQGAHVQALRQALPFDLSMEQEEAAQEILADMQDGTHIMNRLLLGDVGTGKTAVACFALACAADSGYQACVMAPTSVLAQQYAVKCGPLLEAAGVRCALVTGATPAAERKRIAERLQAGTLSVLFGTNAVLSDDIQFKKLSLVVIDEQHRFGVNQRNSLRAKGPGADLLVMTATPIPRTLALSVYGDLDTSIIRHRPVEGAGVTTQVLTEPSRDLAYDAIRSAVGHGHQAYVICPLVAPSKGAEDLDDVPGIVRDDDGSDKNVKTLHDVETELERLRVVFPELRIAPLTGRMGAAEKGAAIEAFRAGDIDVLVSTTVVEVGVDVPNATVMVIENGERFGLATLHQLRGRVGRGEHSGRCIVLTHAKQNGRRSKAQNRLEALEHTEDGFALAQLDLQLRHEGEILGLRQSGGLTLRFVDLDDDTDIIEWAHGDAKELLRHSPRLNATATLPLRHEVIRKYGDVFKEVSGG